MQFAACLETARRGGRGRVLLECSHPLFFLSHLYPHANHKSLHTVRSLNLQPLPPGAGTHTHTQMYTCVRARAHKHMHPTPFQPNLIISGLIHSSTLHSFIFPSPLVYSSLLPPWEKSYSRLDPTEVEAWWFNSWRHT